MARGVVVGRKRAQDVYQGARVHVRVVTSDDHPITGSPPHHQEFPKVPFCQLTFVVDIVLLNRSGVHASPIDALGFIDNGNGCEIRLKGPDAVTGITQPRPQYRIAMTDPAPSRRQPIDRQWPVQIDDHAERIGDCAGGAIGCHELQSFHAITSEKGRKVPPIDRAEPEV